MMVQRETHFKSLINNFNKYKLINKIMSSCGNKACIDKPTTSLLDEGSGDKYLTKQIQMEMFYPQRPLFRTEIGRMTWRLFHRFSAIYDKESQNDKTHFNNFVEGLSLFFPCSICKEDFQIELRKVPLSEEILKSKESIVNFACLHHNKVNEKLGKEKVNCDNISRLISEYSF